MPKNIIEYVIKTTQSGTGAADAKDDLEGLSSIVKGAGTALASFLTVEAVKSTFELGRLGAESLRTKTAFENISGGAGQAADNLAAMQSATRGAISETSAMQAANQLMQMGLANTSQELFDVSEMAVRLGTAMGRDATASIEEFSLLLANQSIPRLDTFGISASNVRTRITQLQQATANLTREEAFAIAVREEGIIAMDRLGDSAEDDLLAFERLEATTENLKTAIGEKLAPWLAKAAGAMELLLTWSDRIEAAYRDQQDVIESTSGSYREYAEATIALAANKSNEAAGNVTLMESQLGVAGMIDLLAERGEILTRQQFEMNQVLLATAAAGNALSTEFFVAESAAIAVGAGIEGAATAAEKAVSFFGGLISTTSELGGQFKNANISGEETFNLLLKTEKGAELSAKQVGLLALNLGVADRAQIRAKSAQLGLVEAWDLGKISSQELQEGLVLLEEATRLSEESFIAQDEAIMGTTTNASFLSEEMFRAAEEIANASGAADDFVGALRAIPDTKQFDFQAEGLEDAARDAIDVKTNIDAIPFITKKFVIIRTIHVTDDDPIDIDDDDDDPIDDLDLSTAGGTSTGTGTATRGDNTFIRQGDTIIIQDTLAAQLALEMSQTDILRTFE